LEWDSDINEEWWDEKLATEPSWFDKLLSYMLLFLPMLLSIPVNKLFVYLFT
jgi:hypothetical protein